MLYLKTVIISGVLIVFSFFMVISAAYSQVDEKTKALAKFDSLPPEEKEAMLKMLIANLPAERKSKLQEAFTSIVAKTPEVITMKLKKKTVSFVPLSHANTVEFYDSVKNIVLAHKAKGYVVYYEQIKYEMPNITPDSVKTLRLKFRKILGTEATRETFSVLKMFFPNIIAQPQYLDLGVSKTDSNADVTIQQFIEKYEKLYGKIMLNQCDLDTKLGTLMYTCGKLTNKDEPVTLDYRNEHVVNLIKSSKAKKILVLYGANHIKGMMDLISE